MFFLYSSLNKIKVFKVIIGIEHKMQHNYDYYTVLHNMPVETNKMYNYSLPHGQKGLYVAVIGSTALCKSI